MPDKFSYILKTFLTTIVVFFLFCGNQAFSQQNISGVVNQYSKVLSVGTNSVTVSDISPFAVNNIVLLMQMAGVVINADPSSGRGECQNTLGSPGRYEFLRISSLNTGTMAVTFTQPLLNTYDPEGLVQLVTVPSYSDAIVTSTLTCDTWNSANGTGGVLAVIAKHKLTLNAAIDVSGMGFKGGVETFGSGPCQQTGSDYQLYFYPADSVNKSGLKGDGVGNKSYNTTTSNTFPGSARGKAPSFSGGGGGNGHYSGGGGGSGYGAGYLTSTNMTSGGYEVSGKCSFAFTGALGGHSYTDSNINGGVFMGGGGGASTYGGAVPSTLSNGANGGGIVIILTYFLEGNNKYIYASGSSAAATTDNGKAGSGGGGGGGAIVIKADVIISEPVLVASGGKGGNNINSTGGTGGGGGGGLIETNYAFSDTTVAGGKGGYYRNTETPTYASGFNGHRGVIKDSLHIQVNWILFNSIYSAVSNSTTDSICEGMNLPSFIGTEPVGGDGTYTYQWQKSYNNSIWSDVSGTSQNYTPDAAETSSVYFRRKVSSNGLINYSNAVYLIVHPAIAGNIIGTVDTICYNQDPPAIVETSSGLSGGNGKYTYTWNQSLNSTTWTLADGSATSSSYDPSALTATHYYYRIVKSGACTDTSLNKTITVLPLIGSNTIASDQTICQGSSFSDLSGSSPSGGNGDYGYKWIASADKSTWGDASGTNAGKNYNPVNDSPGTYYFKRVVMSGLNDCCRDTTSYLTLVSYPSISNNTIASPQTICGGTTINDLTGSLPAGGDGTYTYQWQRSPDNSTWSATGITSKNMTGEQLASTTYYNRIVTSSICPASTSSSLKITVYPVLAGYEIAIDASGHDTILTGTVPAKIKGGTESGGTGGPYSHTWSISTDGINYTDLGVYTPDYQPAALTSTTWFRRETISSPCTGYSVQKITVLPVISGNTISGAQYICNTETPSAIQGSALSGGDGTFKYLWQKRDAVANTWVGADGANSAASYTPPLLNRDTEFRRIVSSGENNCCVDTSFAVKIQIDVMPQSISAGDNTTLLPFQFAAILNGSFEGTGEGVWTVDSSDGDPVFDDNSDPKTVVSKLGFGENTLKWQVSNNKCLADPEYVTLTVPKVIIPEGFSPDNDGLNDYFNISGLEYTTNELVIINTGGAVVYKTKNYRSDDPANAWKGIDNNGNQLPDGTYYFLLTITGATDISVPHYVAHLSGFIIIRR